MDMNNVRAGIATNARTIAGLNALPFSPDDAQEPVFWVGSAEIVYDQAMNKGLDVVTFTAYLAVTKAFDEAAQDMVNDYLNGSGSSSLREKLRTDRTLGGAASDIRLTNARGPIPVQLGANNYLGAVLTIWVVGRGDA